MPSVIIPAHNEAAVIIRCCQALVSGEYAGELEIIVVCNGCEDNTADLVRSFSDEIKVIETDIASKSNALNLGDRAATKFPRFYIDADVVVSQDSIRKTESVLNENNIHAAAPRMQIDLTDRSWFIKAFYKVWLQLPYCRDGMIGSGIYALSKDGRKRFEYFPPITADDGFIRALFTSQERVTVKPANFIIFPPKTLRGIINIKTRAHFGNLELQDKFPELMRNYEGISHSKALKKLARKPKWWAALMIYILVRIVSRAKALKRFKLGISDRWERDDSSR